MKDNIKCNCGLRNGVFCPKCSKVRMVILLKNGNEALKKNGYNPVWYSVLKYNRYDIHRVAEKMKTAFLKTPMAQETNVLQFYINGERDHFFHKIVL